MAIQSIAQLKAWFKPRVYPLASWFHELFDSYWHKSESIPVNSIEGLAGRLNDKADAGQLGSLLEKADDALALARESAETVDGLNERVTDIEEALEEVATRDYVNSSIQEAIYDAWGGAY